MERTNPFTSFAEVREAILNVRAQSDSTAHPSQESQRERQYRQMLSQGVHRSPFTVHRSPFGVRRSAFGVRRSAFGVRRSAFGVRRSAFGGGSEASRFTSSAAAPFNCVALRGASRDGLPASK
jgi:hypothetical protein